MVKFSQEKTCFLEGGRGSRPVSTSWRFGREVMRQREKPSGNLGMRGSVQGYFKKTRQSEQMVAPANARSTSLCLFVSLFVSLFVCLFVSLFVCLFVCL